MSELGDTFAVWREDEKRLRAMYGRPCPECTTLLPKAFPSILLPGQRCKIHGYRDERPRLTNDDREAAGCEFMEKRMENRDE